MPSALKLSVCIVCIAALTACGGATHNGSPEATASADDPGTGSRDTGPGVRPMCALGFANCTNTSPTEVPVVPPSTPTPPADPTTPVEPTPAPPADPTPAPDPSPAPSPPPTGSGTATVFWNPPATQADGTLVGTLTGYRIYYGKSSGGYSGSLFVAGSSGSSGTVSGLDSGTWYFSVSAVDASGNESQLGYEMSKAL